MKIVNLTLDFMFINMPHLFVYGSLLFSDLVKALTGRTSNSVPVTLKGYKRCRIKGCDYPAITEEPGSNVDGLLIKDVDFHSMQILMFFEGDEYQPRQVMVFDQDIEITATTFVWIGEKGLLEDKDWDANEFRQKSLQLYMEEVVPQTLVAFHSQL